MNLLIKGLYSLCQKQHDIRTDRNRSRIFPQYHVSIIRYILSACSRIRQKDRFVMYATDARHVLTFPSLPGSLLSFTLICTIMIIHRVPHHTTAQRCRQNKRTKQFNSAFVTGDISFDYFKYANIYIFIRQMDFVNFLQTLQRLDWINENVFNHICAFTKLTFLYKVIRIHNKCVIERFYSLKRQQNRQRYRLLYSRW